LLIFLLKTEFPNFQKNKKRNIIKNIKKKIEIRLESGIGNGEQIIESMTIRGEESIMPKIKLRTQINIGNVQESGIDNYELQHYKNIVVEKLNVPVVGKKKLNSYVLTILMEVVENIGDKLRAIIFIRGLNRIITPKDSKSCVPIVIRQKEKIIFAHIKRYKKFLLNSTKESAGHIKQFTIFINLNLYSRNEFHKRMERCYTI